MRTLTNKNLGYKLMLLLFLFASCASYSKKDDVAQNNQSQLSDADLIKIRAGFDTRVASYFDEQKNKPLVKGSSRSGFNDAQHYSYPRIEYATVNLFLNQNIDSVNIALSQYGAYFTKKPKNILHRDNFHWHSEMALRLIELFGTKGSKKAGLITPETENKVFEAVWLYAKREQKDQVTDNTKAEADTDESDTWYIYESENHHAQSFTTLWNFAKLIKDYPDFKDRKYDDGTTASQQFTAWNKYLKMFFTERAKKGIYVEMMSRDYNHKSVKGMFNIYDFTTDPELKRKAGLYLDLYFTYWGEEQINGVSGGGKSRLYSDSAPGTSEYGYLFFGIGNRPGFQSTLLSAMTTSYRPPLVVVDIVCDLKGKGNYEVRQRAMGLAENGFNSNPVYHMRTDSGGVVRYSYCTPDFVMGTNMIEARPHTDWTLISSQNQSQGITFAGSERANILPQCEKIRNNRAYNSMWSVQEKGTLITQKLKYSDGTGKAMIWFAEEGLSKPVEEKGWVFSESEGAYAAVKVADGQYYWKDSTMRVKGKWLYCKNEYSPIILEVAQKSKYKSFDEFKNKVTGNECSFKNNILKYKSTYGGNFTFYADWSNVPKINNTPVNYAPAKVYDSPFLKADWNSGIVNIQKGKRLLVLNFNDKK